MMSSVSPLHPIGKLVTPGSSGTFYGLGPSSASNITTITTTDTSTTTTGITSCSAGEIVSLPTINCIQVNLSPSSPTTTSSCSPSTLSDNLSSTILTTPTTTIVSTNPIENLINCSTPSPSIQSSPSSTVDSGNHNGGNCANITNNTLSNGIKSIGGSKDLVKANVPLSWKREKINGSIVYISPSNCFLWSYQDISDYLLTEGTCKCGLDCPIILEEVFNFDPRSPSISYTPVGNQSHPNSNNFVKLGKSFNCKTSENHFHNNNNPINPEYPPKTCNHRRRNLSETLDYSTNNLNTNSNDSNFSIASTTNAPTATITTTTTETRNQQTNDLLIYHETAISEASNQSFQQQLFTTSNHVNQSQTFQQLHNHQQQQQQQLSANSIPFYRATPHQSLINSGVTIFKSDGNFNLTQDKELTGSTASSSSPYSHNHLHQNTNLHKDFQHHSNSSPLTTNSYINWLSINAPDENRLTSIANESQSNVQGFAGTSSPLLPGFADVISGINFTPTLIDAHNSGADQLVQLYNPVPYTSVAPNAVALLSPAQNLNHDGSATILIPSLMQSTEHHHHHQPPIVLNSTENVSTALDHCSRNLITSVRSSPSFSSLPLQTSYTFQPQLSNSYSPASSPSPTQSFTFTPSSITNNNSNENSSDNNNQNTSKSKVKEKLIKRRSPRNRKAKENNQRLNQTVTVSDYYNQKHAEPEKDNNPPISEKETIGADESSSRSQSIDSHGIDEFENNEEPMDSEDCEYEENQFTSQSLDDKSDFVFEKIDDSAQCTSEDIMRELSSHQNSTIRNIGVQSDELISEPDNVVKMVESSDCAGGITKNEVEEDGEGEGVEIGREDDGDDENGEVADEEGEENVDDDDAYSLHSNLADDSEESSEKDEISNLKTTCEFVLQVDEVNEDESFNELDDGIDEEDEFELGNTSNDNDLLSSDDLSVNFVNSDNNNNLSINSDINSFDEDEDDTYDLDDVEQNSDNGSAFISITSTIPTATTIITTIDSKQLNQADVDDGNNNDNDGNYEDEKKDFNDRKYTNDDMNSLSSFDDLKFTTTITTTTAEQPTDEGLREKLSNSNKSTSTKIEDESTKNRNNKRLERLRKELLCYENNFDQTTAQSPPLSPQIRTFETGDLVWGQMRGNPSWPGKLISKEDVPGTNNGQTEKGKVWVKWFGDNLVTQVELDKLKTLSEGLEAHHTARKKSRKGKKTDSCLDQAIQEAMNELDKQIDQQPSSSSPSLIPPIKSKSHPPSTLLSSSSSLPSSSFASS